KVCLMKKSLYGLKQSPRCWNKKFSNFLIESKFNQSNADPCLFIRKRGSKIEIIAIYVDDCILIGKIQNIHRMKELLSNQFKMTDLGEMKSILGIEVEQRKDSITISQRNYITRVLEKFGMVNCRGSDTPIIPNSINKIET